MSDVDGPNAALDEDGDDDDDDGGVRLVVVSTLGCPFKEF